MIRPLFASVRRSSSMVMSGVASSTPRDRCLMGVDPTRSTIPAKRLCARLASFPRKPSPAADARSAYPKSFAGLAMAETQLRRGQHTNPKIEGERFRHVRQPPSPADGLKHHRADSGIPSDSFSSASALML